MSLPIDNCLVENVYILLVAVLALLIIESSDLFACVCIYTQTFKKCIFIYFTQCYWVHVGMRFRIKIVKLF